MYVKHMNESISYNFWCLVELRDATPRKNVPEIKEKLLLAENDFCYCKEGTIICLTLSRLTPLYLLKNGGIYKIAKQEMVAPYGGDRNEG